MVSGFLQSHSEVALLLVLLATFTLAAMVCIYPWRKVAAEHPVAEVADPRMRDAHDMLWDIVSQTPQGKWLHSADDFCLWVSVDEGWLHIERVAGAKFVDRTTEDLLPVTVITSEQSRPEIFVRETTALVGDGRDIYRELLPGGHGSVQLDAYDVRRLCRQLRTAEILI